MPYCSEQKLSSEVDALRIEQATLEGKEEGFESRLESALGKEKKPITDYGKLRFSVEEIVAIPNNSVKKY